MGLPWRARKVREWITLDLIASYTFNLPPPAAAAVPGLAKDGGKNVQMKDGKEKNVLPVSTAEYNPCGWRAWLNNTTLTLGMQNVFDSDPPFVAGAFRTTTTQSLATIKGRFWYVAAEEKILTDAGTIYLDFPIWEYPLRVDPRFLEVTAVVAGSPRDESVRMADVSPAL